MILVYVYLSLFIGFVAGFFTAAILAGARMADEQAEQWQNDREEQAEATWDTSAP